MEAPGRESYAVGIICALALEMAAVRAILDEAFDAPPNKRNASDSNNYSFGQIGSHNVVVACLPAGVMGKVSAASVAMDMMHSFPIKVGLMVGVGGGVWSEKDDVRLGDVVVSQPDGMHGGVVQWDFGKMEAEGRFRRTGTLNKPPTPLLSALQNLKARHMLEDSKLKTHLTEMWEKHTRTAKTFPYPGASNDNLYEASYSHPLGTTCALCDKSRLVQRNTREETIPQVHYGNIASGDEVMKDGVTRDLIAQEEGILCFEMEAAGLMDRFPCVVIRGICDYADSHKNKQWQPYAAATAACYCKELLGVIEPHAVASLPSATQPMTRYECIPFSRNKKFVGRAKELDILETALFVDQSTQQMAIVGLGGVGKTQVALTFAYSVMDNHPDVSVLWLSAMNKEAYEHGCREIARIYGIRLAANVDVKVVIRERLSLKTNGPWLLFVDNADDSDIVFGAAGEAGLLSYLPKSSEGLIVYTTRNHEIAQSLARNDVVEVSGLNIDDATAMLWLASTHDFKNHEEILEVMDLLDELDHLPLAISHAAAYININHLSVSEYLGLLRNSKEDLTYIMSQEMRDSTRYDGSTSAVATTWLVSFKQILHRDPDAADLLQFMSCIEWKAIPRSILPVVEPAARMTSAIGTLCSYSFITRRHGEQTFDMHRLVHLAAQIWVNKCGRTAEVHVQAIKYLAEIFPVGQWEDRAIWWSYYVHVWKLIRVGSGERYDERVRLCFKVGTRLLRDQRIKEAVQWLEESREWSPGDRHPSMMQCQVLLQLGTAYMALNQGEDVVKVLEPLCEGVGQNITLGIHHPHSLAAQSMLAEVYANRGRDEDAQKMLEFVVMTQERLEETRKFDLLASQRRLARVYTKTGQAMEAVGLLERVILVERRAQVRPEDPSMIALQEALATACQENGEVERTVELRALLSELHRQEFPEDDHGQGEYDSALASALIANGQATKAVELMKHVVKRATQTLTEEDTDRLALVYHLAVAYQASGQPEIAVTLLEQVVAVDAKVLSEDHPDRIASERELAKARQACGQEVEEGSWSLTDTAAPEQAQRGLRNRSPRLRL
ncbi:hypothetical protein LTR56_015006 [Elasticomyces elasticus]|nr:hypothetical protein LTR56_015006 [Elasticomyces elasticus]KAK3646970.1 hypothetical protein LTR22_013997 [Elasticomyces elasticus]KAK4916955.1 hypothetical protein LTR49_015130 [Elasticomyces elasticus]